jgi:hypothetical protein
MIGSREERAMPIKVFEKHSSEPSESFEGKVNQWLATLNTGAVKNISATTVQEGLNLAVVVWYEGHKP